MKYDPYSMIKRTSLREKGIEVVENSSKEIFRVGKRNDL